MYPLYTMDYNKTTKKKQGVQRLQAFDFCDDKQTKARLKRKLRG